MLGAHDGIVSTAALIVGVAASDASTQSVLLAAIAGLAAGALSMAAGEYVSVSSQRDLERALRAHEEQLTSGYPEVALTEVAVALQLRGLAPGLARTVAEQLVALSPVETAVRVKYGLSSALAARPSSAALAASGAWAARLGGASAWRGAWRVLLGGSLAMGLSALIGRAVGTVV